MTDTKPLQRLPEDIYTLFQKEHKIKGDIDAFAKAIAKRIQDFLNREEQKPYLRPSNVGKPCARELWYAINEPEKAEQLPPWKQITFLFGHVLEELVLFLAREAGYEVTNEQRTIEVDGVKGSLDATVNGHLVDVKSASSFSFNKFDTGLTPEKDAFGYLTQLGVYAKGIESSSGAFIAIDKQHGYITVDHHDQLPDPTELIAERKRVVSAKRPPARAFKDVPDGASGNRVLGLNCSYCPFRKHCWPGLRTFVSSKGPVYYTDVKREPRMSEVYI